MKIHQGFICALVSGSLVVATVGCGGGNGGGPSQVPTPMPTASPTAMATATPTPTATPTSTLNDNDPTLFYYKGEQGDFISQGRTVLLKPPEFKTNVSASRNSVSFSLNNFDSVEFSQGRFYGADFAAPPGQELKVGTYTNAKRFPFNDNNPGLNISGEGRGNNMLTGNFTIRQISFNANNQLQNFEADFEQFSENSSKKLTGTIRFNSTLR